MVEIGPETFGPVVSPKLVRDGFDVDDLWSLPRLDIRWPPDMWTNWSREAGIELPGRETIWYDALSADPFVAKCAAPVAEGTAARCLRTVYLGPGLAAVYAFSADVLENWKRFDPEIRALLTKIGV